MCDAEPSRLGKKTGSGETITDTFDRLVLATGASAIRPKIEGIDLGNVFYLRSIFDADAFIQRIRSESIRDAVIAGGGYIGLEMAESLVRLGKNVTIAELAPQILTLFDEDFAGILQQYLEKKGVKIFGDGPSCTNDLPGAGHCGSGLCSSIQSRSLSGHRGGQCVDEQNGGKGRRDSSLGGEREDEDFRRIFSDLGCQGRR